MGKQYNLPCNIAKTLEIIGDRWTLLIIRELIKGRTRFNELKEALEGIAPNILSERLRYLEAEGIVSSNLYVKHPPRFDYELTEKGKELKHVLNALAIWGNRHFETRYYDLVHTECGHEVETSYFCPSCNIMTGDIRYRTHHE